MKKFLIVFVLAVFGFIAQVVSADEMSFQIGTVESHESMMVADIAYNKYVIDGAGPDTHIIHNVEFGRYSEFEIVLHDMLFGPEGQGLSTVREIALDYEIETGKVVYAAFNGDFFSFETGLPVGFYAVDGVLLQLGYNDLNSFGFTGAHKTRIGDVEYGYKLLIYDETDSLVGEYHVNRMNENLLDGEIGIFTPDVSSVVQGDNLAKLRVNDEPIDNDSEKHYVGQPLSDVSAFTFDTADMNVNENTFVLAANGDSEAYQSLNDNLTSTSTLEVYPYPTGQWEDMDYIIGGRQILFDRGDKLPEPIHGSVYSRHPRTSIAVSREGEMAITIVDGRQDGVPGVTLGELASINEDFGYYTALELDGGGSSTCLLRNLETDELDIMNTPSDGELRGVSNAVLIVGDPIDDGNNDHPNTTTQTTITAVITTTETTTITTRDQIDEPGDDESSSCGLFQASQIVYGFLFILGYLWYRKK